MEWSQKLLCTNWMKMFDLFNVPINTFCRHIINQHWKLKRKLETNFPKIFSKGLGFCSKGKVKFNLKVDATSIFWPKRHVRFVALANIDKEHKWLEKLGVIGKTDYSPCTSPTIYLKKKNNKIRVCADYSTGLNFCAIKWGLDIFRVGFIGGLPANTSWWKVCLNTNE